MDGDDEIEATWADVPKVMRFVRRLRVSPQAPAIKEFLAGVSNEEIEECDYEGQTVLHYACLDDSLPPDALEAVLDSMSKEGIMIVDMRGWDALAYALRMGKRNLIPLLAERQKREENWNPFAVRVGGSSRLDLLALSALASDKEVVDLVVASASAEDFTRRDHMLEALQSRYDAGHLIDALLEFGPPLGDRLLGTNRLLYVQVAGARNGMATVKKMLEQVPVLADGRRASAKEFAKAIAKAGHPGGEKLEIMQYLAEEAGSAVFDHLPPGLLKYLAGEAEAEWVLTQAPHLLDAGAKSGDLLYAMVYREGVTDYLVEQTLQHVDHSVIADMLVAGRYRRAKYWRVKVRRLFEEVAEKEVGTYWRILMDAISSRQEEDIEFMATVCPRGDLTRQDSNGNTALELARKNKWVKEDTLARLAAPVPKRAEM